MICCFFIAILYSCPFLGLDCGQCLAIEDVYGCGYCRSPTSRCILTSTTCGSLPFLTDVTQINDCEDPVITNVSSYTLVLILYYSSCLFSCSFLQPLVQIMEVQSSQSTVVILEQGRVISAVSGYRMWCVI